MQPDRDNVVILPVVARPRPLPEPANDNDWLDLADLFPDDERDPVSGLFDDDFNEVHEENCVKDGSNVIYPAFRRD